MPDTQVSNGQDTSSAGATSKIKVQTGSCNPSPSRHSTTSKKTPLSPASRDEEDGLALPLEIQTRQLRARERVMILRGRVLRTRDLKRTHKSELRELQDNVRIALDKFTRYIHEAIALGKGYADISSYYEEFRAAQDKLGPADDQYDSLERRLDEEEQELEQEEQHFSRNYEFTSGSVAESKLNETLSPLIKSSQSSEADAQSLSLENVVVQEYLDRIQTANRLKEELNELEDDYYRYSEDAKLLKAHSIPLSEERKKILTDYPKLHSDILDRLHEVEDAIFDLRHDCISQGLFIESEHVYEPRDALYEEVMEAVYEAQDRSPLHVAVHRIKYPRHTKDFGDKRAYVNHWLMHWVQNSSVDVLRLKMWIHLLYPDIPEKGKDLENDKWSNLALENWDRDDMGARASEFYNASRLDAIAGDTSQLVATSAGLSDISDSSLDIEIDEYTEINDIILESQVDSNATEKGGDAEFSIGLTPEVLTNEIINPGPLKNIYTWPQPSQPGGVLNLKKRSLSSSTLNLLRGLNLETKGSQPTTKTLHKKSSF